MGRVLVALGGNALNRAGGDGSWNEATERMRATVPSLVSLARDGHELILTHGNGPQVGALLRQNELGEREVPRRPLHALVAESQGQIGLLIEQELSAALARAGHPRTVVGLISRIVVSPKDPAFRRPTKPVGRYYTETEARVLRKQASWQMVFDAARGGWRRVVPSPAPVEWLERAAIRGLYDAGMGPHWVPIIAGGGGVPVVPRGRGAFEGVEAVIDKDATAALIARDLAVDTLAIVTDVPAVAVGFRKPWEKWLGSVTKEELAGYLARGEFGEGSMRPKVEAILGFLENGGRSAVITDIPSLARALSGDAGTRVERP